MGRDLIKYFWQCGDDSIIQFAIIRAHLNRREKDVILYALDDCMTQEEIAENMGMSVRKIQGLWYSGVDKLLNIPWVKAYALAILHGFTSSSF